MPPPSTALSDDALRVVPSTSGAGAQPYTARELFQWRLFVSLGLLVPVAATGVALVRLWRVGPVLSDFIAFGVSYTLTSFGITAGYHRLLSHRSFVVPRWLYLTFAVLGSMSLIGPVAIWVATHRRHHAYADRDGDPHSPHRPYEVEPKTLLQRWRSIVHGYAGWLFTPDYSPIEVWAPELAKDPAIMFVNRNFNGLALFAVLAPAVVTFAFTRTLSGFLGALLWGGLVRVCVTVYMTFFVNTITHVTGDRPFKTRDRSGNVWQIALLSLGEGWHNNHHAFPSAAMAGLRWWELDPSGWLIRTFEACGIATQVKRVSEELIARKRAAAEAVE